MSGYLRELSVELRFGKLDLIEPTVGLWRKHVQPLQEKGVDIAMRAAAVCLKSDLSIEERETLLEGLALEDWLKLQSSVMTIVSVSESEQRQS